jgi:DNA (cytosine-5)-methyltransferase 1
MHSSNRKFVGIDLFSGAGGLSLGANMAGIDVVLAVEKDRHAATTYALNHPNTELLCIDIQKLVKLPDNIDITGCNVILFGGPPCQGFSTSNRRTWSKSNPQNHLYKEFVRIARLIHPEWIVFENVTGFASLASGEFLKTLVKDLTDIGFKCSYTTLTASDYGIPQRRNRFFLIGSKSGGKVEFEIPTGANVVTVEDAISDLPILDNGASVDILPYKNFATNSYARALRGELEKCGGHLVSRNSSVIIERYEHIEQGGNWKSIPPELMRSYTDRTRCHTGIYHRLRADKPSVVIGNYRKNMLIHPWSNRGLSIREAARLQSFPDSYTFSGSIGFQQQQVGNAVPPLLAKEIFGLITKEGASHES